MALHPAKRHFPDELPVEWDPIRRALADGALRVVLQDYQVRPMAVSLVYPSQRLLPLKLRAFLDLAAPPLRAQLAPQAVK